MKIKWRQSRDKAIEWVATIDGPYAGFAFDDGEDDDDGIEYDESEEEEEQVRLRQAKTAQKRPDQKLEKKYNTIMQRRTELRNDDDDDVGSLDRSTRDMTIESQDSSGLKLSIDDTRLFCLRDRVDRQSRLRRRKYVEIGAEDEYSDMNSTYGSFQFDDNSNRKM